MRSWCARCEARIGALEGELDGMSFRRSTIKDGATGADGEIPEHVREIVDFISMRTRAEIEWTQGAPQAPARRRVHLRGRARLSRPRSRTRMA